MKTSENRLYLSLKAISGFIDPKDLILMTEKSFAGLCNADYIVLRLQNPPPALKTLPSTPPEKLRFSIAEPLKAHNSYYGKLLFFFNKKGAVPLSFAKAAAEALSSSLYCMERRRKLQALQEKWSVIFDSFSRPVCITDESGAVLKSNSAFRELAKEDSSFPKIALKTAGSKSPSISSFESSLHKTRSGQFIESQSFSLMLKGRRFFIIMASNVRRETYLQKRLTQLEREGELGFIQGSIAHELNNPLSGMKTLLHIIEQKGLKKEAEGAVRELGARIESCLQTVESLLKASA